MERNWNLLKFDWERAKALVAVAEAGTFSGAAELLKLAQPTLGRQIKALEDELGVALVEKVGKRLELTPIATEILEKFQLMAEAAEEVSLIVKGNSKELEGTVSISASESYAAFLLPKILLKMRREYPKIHIDIIATNDSTDLIKRDADIAIRNYRPVQNDLIIKNIGQSKFHIYGTQEYLDELGEIKEVSDLNRANFIGIMERETLIQGLNVFGLNLDQENFPINSSSHLAHWEIVKQGGGLGLMASSVGDREEGLVKVLPDSFPEMIVENWLVSHRDLKNSYRIRAVYDFLYQELKRTLLMANEPF